MANTCVKRTPGSDGNSKKFTWSGWVKRSGLGVGQHLWATWYQNNSRYSYFRFSDDDTLEVYSGEYSTSPTSTSIYLNTKAKFSDTNGWYHVVLRVDTDDSTQADRVRVYVNNVSQEFNASHSNGQTLPGSGTVTFFNKQYLHTLGRYANSGGFFNGLMSHVHWCDGYSYAPTEFGETDSTTGEWKIKTIPSVSYGTNGYFLLKDGNSTTDQSGNGLSFTTEGTLTKTEDNPSNVFATWNPLAAHSSNTPTFSNGNNTVVGVDTSSQTVSSTLAMPKKGKWYCEMKLTQEANATSSIPNFGIIDAASLYKFRNQEIVVYNGGVNSYGGRVNTTNLAVDGSDSGTISSAPDVGDIMGLAVDLDSSPNTLKYYLNGSLVGTQNINNDEYVFACSIKNDNNAGQVDVNFGNGYFGSTQISSAGTNASNIGIFEYDVPSGYTALSTKGLNE